MYDIAVVTPSIGRPELKNAIDSVRDQILIPGMSVKHYVVFDGPSARQAYRDTLPATICEMTIPFNTGKGGFYGHKIMGAMCSLLKEGWVCFLDDDNTFEPDHLKKMVETAQGKDWVFSYRNMWVDGKFYHRDTYESLGPYRTVSGDPNYKFLIDTNCYLIKRPIALSACQAWLTGWGADRVLSEYLMRSFPRYACTFAYTVNYAIPKNLIWEDYVSPIDSEPVFVFHMTAEATSRALQQYESYEKAKSTCSDDEEPYYDPHIGQKQWQLNFFVNSPFRAVNGFDSYMHAPAGSTFLFNLFDIDHIPVDAYKRKDVKKILYTIESPNVKYVKNWKAETLANFDVVVTYWKDAAHPRIIEHPFVNKLNLHSTVELESLTRSTSEREENICCVLNNRSTNGEYEIDDKKLKSLDYLRLESMRAFQKAGYEVVGYGDTWRSSGIPNRTTKSRFLDVELVTDIYKKHRYVYISENTNARGYVSEKIFDALIAGCTPIYCCDESNYEFMVEEFGKVAIIMKPGIVPELRPLYNRKEALRLLSKYSIDKLLLKINSIRKMKL